MIGPNITRCRGKKLSIEQAKEFKKDEKGRKNDEKSFVARGQESSALSVPQWFVFGKLGKFKEKERGYAHLLDIITGRIRKKACDASSVDRRGRKSIGAKFEGMLAPRRFHGRNLRKDLPWRGTVLFLGAAPRGGQKAKVRERMTSCHDVKETGCTLQSSERKRKRKG